MVVHAWAPADAEQPWGQDAGGAEALVAELRADGAEAVHVAADFARPEAPAEVLAAARAAFGHVDVLVANHARSSSVGLEDLTAPELDLTYAVNTRATLLLVRELAAQHDGRPGGRVVLFTSGQHHGAMPGELPYIASKGALHQLTPEPRVPPRRPRHHRQLRRPRADGHGLRGRRADGRGRPRVAARAVGAP